MFTKLFIGEDDDLGKDAFRDTLIALSENEAIPKTIVFWNNAVKACVEHSPVLQYLNKLERQGVRILVSGSALERLDLKHSLRAGKLANHFDLLDAFSHVQKVVNF